jgi:hypothetical protein
MLTEESIVSRNVKPHYCGKVSKLPNNLEEEEICLKD